MTHPAHREAPRLHVVCLVVLPLGGHGEAVAGEDFPPVDAPDTAEFPTYSAVPDGDGVEEGQTTPTLPCVSPKHKF